MATIKVTSNDSWTASTNNSWLTLSNPTGTGDGEFYVSCAANSSTTSKSGNISLTTTRGASAIIPVSQAGAASSISVSPVSWNTTCGHTTQEFTVTSNDSWTVSTPDLWLTLSTKVGAGNQKFTVTCPATLSLFPQTGTINVSTSNITKTIHVTQEGVPSTIKVDPWYWNAPFVTSLFTVFVESNDEWTATLAFPDTSSWLSIIEPRGTGIGHFTVRTTKNVGSFYRLGTVKVQTNGGSEAWFEISQEPQNMGGGGLNPDQPWIPPLQ